MLKEKKFIERGQFNETYFKEEINSVLTRGAKWKITYNKQLKTFIIILIILMEMREDINIG